MRSILYIIAGFGILSACSEGVELDLEQTPAKVVIEGLVTDKPGYQSVKITRSIDFYSQGKTPRVTDAVVSVKDDQGREVPFVHNPRNHADSAGIYVPQVPFVGAIGRVYALRVQVGAEVYE